jgi:hypothetical protein
MKRMSEGYGYNERLFTGQIRRYLHLARFRWFQREVIARGCKTESMLEIGCFDGKAISFLPTAPRRYLGFDANWEGGLDLARQTWREHTDYEFCEASSPSDLRIPPGERFDIAVAMETLEHIPPEMLDDYIAKVAEHLDGLLFVTVPNEKGLLFLLKWCVKRLLSGDGERYAWHEVVNATLGRMDRVARDQHKGFDYDAVVQQIGKHFDVLEVSGHPMSFFPQSLCFGIGIVAAPKR